MKKEGKLKILGEYVGHLLPVSYTHLDVYKRQRQECAATMFGQVFLPNKRQGEDSVLNSIAGCCCQNCCC